MQFKEWKSRRMESMPWWLVAAYSAAALLFGFDLMYAVDEIAALGPRVAWGSEVMAAWAQAVLSGLAIVAAVLVFRAGELARVAERHRYEYEYMAKAYYVCVTAASCARTAMALKDLGPVSEPGDIDEWQQSFVNCAETIERGMFDLDRVDPVAVRLSTVALRIMRVRRYVGSVLSMVNRAGRKSDCSQVSGVESACKDIDNDLAAMRDIIDDFAKRNGLRGVEPVKRD